MENRILLIEDDPDITELVRINLEDAGYRLDSAADGEKGLETALAQEIDLVILDLQLPRMDGLEVCRQLQQRKRHLPILMLTSRSEEVDRVLGLELGADDYLTKPFSIRELVARVRAILRRLERSRTTEKESVDSPLPLDLGDLIIDPDRRRVTLDGEPVELTAKEFDLLLMFASHPGRVYSRQMLLELVWGYQYRGYEHTVNSHIHRLRAKIESDASHPRYITTVWGVG
jgi:DNA-binding response OmpR family regulator